MPAMVNHDDLIGFGKREGLVVPDAPVSGPRMQEHDRRALPIRIVVNLDRTVLRVWHYASLLMAIIERARSSSLTQKFGARQTITAEAAGNRSVHRMNKTRGHPHGWLPRAVK